MTTQSKGIRVNGHANATKLPTISLCMIVKDEAANLAACLMSVLDLVDEIIVVDTGSTDDTADIAKAMGARVFYTKWTDDFAAARNESLAHATRDWILVLDGDERLSMDDAPRRVKEFLRDNGPAIYCVEVVSEVGSGAHISHVTPRLFPNHPQIGFTGTIHETPVDSRGKLETVIVKDIRIIHGGYAPAVMASKDKYSRNTGLIKAAIAQDPNNPQLRLYLGTTHQEAGALGLAVEEYRQVLWLSRLHPEAANVRAQAAANIITCLGKLEMYAQAALEIAQCLHDGPIQHPSFWVSKGNNENHLGNYREAIASFHTALSHAGNEGAQQVDTGCVTWMPYAGIGLALANLGECDGARVALEKALTWNLGPYTDKVRAVLAEVTP